MDGNEITFLAESCKIHQLDIAQPDLSHAGGITEVKKIASMAEAYDVALAHHCSLGPLALAAYLQVGATCHNAVIQEQSMGIHYNVGRSVMDYVVNKADFQFRKGYVGLPSKPGLGVEINKDLVIRESNTPHGGKTLSGVMKTVRLKSGDSPADVAYPIIFKVPVSCNGRCFSGSEKEN